jgi:hypothetical protein
MPADLNEPVFVGVDTHADAHRVAVVDSLGRHLGDREFPADPVGYRDLLDWVGPFGGVRRHTRLTPTTNTSSSDHIRPTTIDLGATAHLFHAGHRIRLQISSGAHPRHNRNLGTAEPVATATTMRSADQEVFHDSSRPSALILPTAAK